METKPFSFQSPFEALKEFGPGQHLLAAVDRGQIDLVTATLAQQIHTRAVADAQKAPTRTVAEQLFDVPAPPAPPQMPMQAPQGAPAGLGALPPGAAPDMSGMMAPPPAPEMPMPQEEAPPMSMADGGLASLPVPDAMFDENSNGGFDDGYAGGGILAFAGGSPGELRKPEDWGTYIEETARGLFPNLDVSGRGRTGARNTEVGGVTDSFHLIDAARDLRTPPGMTKSEFITQLKGAFGSDYDVLPSKGSSVHVEPGPALGRMVRAGTPVSQSNVPRGSGAASGLSALASTAAPDFEGTYERGLARGKEEAASIYPDKRPALDRFTGEAKRILSPEYQKQERDQGKWEFLANLGFGMAGTKSPYLLQAVGASAAAALPGLAENRKALKAEARQAYRDLADAENISISQAEKKAKYAREVAADTLGVVKAKSDYLIAEARNQLGWGEITARKTEGQADRENKLEVERLQNLPEVAGGKPLSATQQGESMERSKDAAVAAIAAARAAEKRNDPKATENYLTAYRVAIDNYNRYAASRGESPYTAEDLSGGFPNLNKYFKEKGQLPSGAGRSKSQGAPPMSTDVPAGINPAEWGAMTPQERALFPAR